MNMDLAKQVKIHIFKSFLVPHKLKDLAFSYFLKKSFLKEHFDLTLPVAVITLVIWFCVVVLTEAL